MKISKSKLRKMINEAIQKQTYEELRKELLTIWNAYWTVESFFGDGIFEWEGVVSNDDIEQAKTICNALSNSKTSDFIKRLLQQLTLMIDGKNIQNVEDWVNWIDDKYTN